MPDALVETKLVVPRARARTVDRPRLDELLALSADATLLLVSAAAGFGKTTLLATWLARAQNPHPVAWVSLDERDRDASTFWTYVLRAVDRAATGTATAALELQSGGQAPIDVVLTALLNELSVLPGDLTLVLDDYHLAEDSGTRAGMVFLLEHLPPHVHLVVSSRSDPALPLARLRARGELVEVRAADLRFTRGEAATYLNELNALALSPEDVAALERRTEGWAAALQLAALSLSGRDDRSQFIAGFAGDDRFVVDYLGDEVLDGLPEGVRRFLLDTSVLERLTGPLCDAVTGGPGGKAALELLERQNLFVIPLDGHRRVVPVPPPVRRRAARPPRGRAARRRARAAPAGGRLVRPRRGMPRRPFGMRSPRATSTWRPPGPSWPSRTCCARGGRRSSVAGPTCCPPTWRIGGRCSRSGSSAPSRRATSSTRWTAG